MMEKDGSGAAASRYIYLRVEGKLFDSPGVLISLSKVLQDA